MRNTTWSARPDGRVAVNETESQPSLPPSPICRLDELPDHAARAFQLLRRKKSGRATRWSIFVVRKGDVLAGYYNTCPHAPYNLDCEGNGILTADGHLQCGKHGARFEVESGKCFDGPCAGARLKGVELSVVDGAVCVNNVELVSPSAAEAS
jgi:nitrite reductase/ring-hydroxylating ferredoxin subunit